MTHDSHTPRPRRSPPRRGIILVFVVVLLVLLAIMGTAYLATTRADLVTIRGRGAGPNPNTPLLVNRVTLDQAYAAVQERLKVMVGVEDLVGTNVGASDSADASADARRYFYRQPIGTYENLDALGATFDPWLASTLPEREVSAGPAPRPVIWPWVSGAVATPTGSGAMEFPGEFADPRFVDGSGFIGAISNLNRTNVQIGSIAMRAATGSNIKTNRVYPGLGAPYATGLPGGATAVIAGDADGDGIADSFLIPILINPALAGINQYVDQQNGVIYYYAYRVVDNSSQINLGTALSVSADFPISMLGDGNPANNDIDTAGETRELMALNTRPAGSATNPNFGFFRSNVGLIELINDALSIYTGQTTPNTPTEKDVRRFVDLRFPDLKTDPAGAPNYYAMRQTANIAIVGGANGTIVGDPTTIDTYEFRSFGDMLEQQVVKRPSLPLGWYYHGTSPTERLATISTPGVAELGSLHDKGGSLINPVTSAGGTENALMLSLRAPTPNFVSRTESVWKWFPPENVQLWFEWTKNLDGLRRDPTDPNIAANPTYFTFNAATVGTSFQTGMTPVDLQRSIRSLVTTRNGEMSATPVRSDLGGLVPLGMPPYAANSNLATLNTPPYGAYPAAKVSAATGSKRQLWRAFWSVMTVPINPTTAEPTKAWGPESSARPTSFFSTARFASGTGSDTISGRNMVLIRSAIAAVNTIDLRDKDDDITELTVTLEADPPTSTTQFIARVFGTEKRPYITEVLWTDADGTGVASGADYMAIEIYNPHDVPIDVANYYIGYVNRTGNTLANGEREVVANSTWRIGDTVGGPVVIAPGKFALVVSSSIPPVSPPIPTTPTDPVDHIVVIPDPLFLNNASGNELVMGRYRRADGVPTVDPTGQYSELAFPANDQALLSMVPMETIDMRYVAPTTSDATAWQYRRTAANPLNVATADARWRCVYGGQMFDVNETDQNLTTPQFLAATNAANSPAWKEYTGVDFTVVPPHTLGVYDTVAPVLDAPEQAYVAPAIQIQNFTPEDDDTTYLAAHPDEKFPFGSPFARDGDVLNVPFVGAYTILRRTGATAFDTFEITALPMDAWLADPNPILAVTNLSVGRFDPRATTTEWSRDLFDFITARQAPANDFFPDVPKVLMNGTTTSDVLPAAPTGTEAFAYVGGDGPVKGTEGTANPSATVRKTSYGGGAYGRVPLDLNDVSSTDESRTLIQGKLNINTAPAVNLRMLPLTVDLTTGTSSGSARLLDNAAIVDDIITARATAPFTSMFDLLDRVPSLVSTNVKLQSDPTLTRDEMLFAGDLSGLTNKPVLDYQSQMINLNRLSNLITTRSDVYTVYVSVQAWTYRPQGQNGWDQAQDTRLVGERRGAFVLDRSQVTPDTGLNTRSLLIYPVAEE